MTNVANAKTVEANQAVVDMDIESVISELELDLTDDASVVDALLAGEEEASLTEADMSFEAEAAMPSADEEMHLDEIDVDGLDLSELDPASLEQAAQPAAETAAPVAEPEQPAAPEPAKEVKPKAPKADAAPRTTYINSKASKVLVDRLGGDIAETLLLEVSDIDLDREELEKKQAKLLSLLNVRPHHTTADSQSTQKKVAEKVVMLFAYIKNGGKLNEVMARTFKVLLRDGYIQSGDKGNLHLDLLEKPYSPGTARAQAGQMMKMLPMLKIATEGNKGQLIANPNSLILLKMKSELSL